MNRASCRRRSARLALNRAWHAGCKGNSPEVAARRFSTPNVHSTRSDPSPCSTRQETTMTLYAAPGTPGAKHSFKARYDNFIGGQFVPPVERQYFDVITPITGQVYTQAARSTAADIELALDAAHAAKAGWAATPAAARANILLQIADRIDANLELLAYAETVGNGKAIRETLNADIPLSADHFRYFAGCLRAQEGSLTEVDGNTIAYHFHEPLGVVGQIIPWNFPILMAAWKLAPALGAGNCVVLKPAESTPVSILVLAELIADLLPPGVL